jgi:hypothetical protein
MIDILTLVVFLALIDTGLLLEFVLPAGSGQGRLLVLGLGRHDWGAIHFWLSVATVVLVVVHVVLHWNWIYATVRKHAAGSRPANANGSGRRIAGGVTGALMLLLTLGVVALMGATRVENDGNSGGGHRHGRSGQISDRVGEPTGQTEVALLTEDQPARAEATGSRGGGWAGGRRQGSRSGGSETHSDEPLGSLRGSMTFTEVARSTGLSVQTVVAAADLPTETSPDARVGRTLRDHESDMELFRAALAALVDVEQAQAQP